MLPFNRALVTGGAGFIGSHIVDHLLEEGCEIVVLDDFSSGNLSNLRGVSLSKNFTLIEGSINDEEVVKKVLKDAEVVFHEAAIVSVPKSIEDPKLVNHVNVDGTLNLLRNALNYDIERFVLASSAAVYGDGQKAPQKEDGLTRPISPYGLGKLTAERDCLEVHKMSGLRTTVLRYFNAYGPRSNGGPYSSVINKFIERLMHKESPIIYGSGKQIRDFVSVEDIVRANIMAALSGKSIGRVYNVATGIPVSIEKLAHLLCDLMLGKDTAQSFDYMPKLLGDIEESLADISLIQKDLEFYPKFTIEDGLRKYLDLIQQVKPLVGAWH
jgi:UDP-glucose 4-epimerase